MSTRLINTRKNYQTYTKTVPGDDGLVIPFENVCTGHVGVVHIICDGATNINALPFQEPVYIEISADTDLSGSGLNIDGNEVIVYNTDVSSHTITYDGSTSESIPPGGTAMPKYCGGWILNNTQKQTITVSGAIAFNNANQEIEVDLSVGNISISQLPAPDFIGQRVHIYGSGTFIGDIAGGTGLYANGVYFTENTGGVFLTAISLTEWRAENGVTADYISSSHRILKYANGYMELQLVDYIGITTQVVSLPVSFTSTSYKAIPTSNTTNGRYITVNINTISQVTLYGWNSAGAPGTTNGTAILKGDYT